MSVARDFSKGKIYKIVSDSSEKVYIGSTTWDLNERFELHKKDALDYVNGVRKYPVTSYELIKFGDAHIELIEDYKCDSSVDLRMRENEYVEYYKGLGVCVNNRNIVKGGKLSEDIKYKRDKNRLKKEFEKIVLEINGDSK